MPRADSIIARFPAFFRSEDRDNDFYRYIGAFGELLDAAEQDLIRVMHAHWVNTADNDGSQGFDAAEKGDLDKIFALYLESLGGTALLRQAGRPTGDDERYQRLIQGLLGRIDRIERGREFDRRFNPASEPLTKEEISTLVANLAVNEPDYADRINQILAELSDPAQQKVDLLARLRYESDPDVFYRERIMGLIRVLREGASTIEGIREIVAANLGVVGDSPAAQAARRAIKIIEYRPEIISATPLTLPLFVEFDVVNPNPNDSVPEVRITTRDDFYAPIVGLRLVDTQTGDFVQHRGVLQSRVLSGNADPDFLQFLTNDTTLLNGDVAPFSGSIPTVPGATTRRWRVEALVDLDVGRFDRSRFDYSLFAGPRTAIGPFNPANNLFFNYNESQLQNLGFPLHQPAIELELIFQKLHPGSFTVQVPWDLPGFTEKFEQLPDDPRQQIKPIVERVKAAGVLAVVAFEKKFQEDQELDERLTLESLRTEDQEMEEDNFLATSVQSPYPDGLEHELRDELILSGVFDLTSFDMLNTFA